MMREQRSATNSIHASGDKTFLLYNKTLKIIISEWRKQREKWKKKGERWKDREKEMEEGDMDSPSKFVLQCP